jgi:arginine metabolism regulation protein II
MRIVSESTNVLHEEPRSDDNAGPNQDQVNKQTADGHRVPRPIVRQVQIHASLVRPHVTLDSFLRLEPRLSATEDDNPHTQEVDGSIGDIHMPETRQDRDSVCMQIYGVPETWLSLVSQTTRLANVMERIPSGEGASDAATQASLQSRASRLENTICSLSSRDALGASSEAEDVSHTADVEQPHVHMQRALNSALMIFFYRRIRNIHPWVLRHDIDSVINSLHAFDFALEKGGLRGPGSAWAAFVAGAEAITPRQRRQTVAWLDRASSKSGFVSYATSKEVILETWRQRDASPLCDASYANRSGSPSDMCFPTWMEVCRTKRWWPLLC